MVAQPRVEIVYGHHKGKVLGVSTSASELQFPEISSGPGLILPDSPLYFLDNVFQSIRLTTALNSEARAKLRAQIAGERLAELRIMLARNNTQGIDTAMAQLTKEVGLSAQHLAEAGASGKDTSLAAKEINEIIKTQREILKDLEHQATGALKLELKTARQALKEAKVEVEDELPEDELEKEIEEGLNEEIEDEVEEGEDEMEELEDDLDELEKQVSSAAQKSLKKREELLLKAIKEKNESLRKLEEKRLENEKKRIELFLKTNKDSSEHARRSLKESQEAAQKYEEARKRLLELQQNPFTGLDTVGSTPTEVKESFESQGESNSGSSSSSESGSSGSSSSGSDDSEE